MRLSVPFSLKFVERSFAISSLIFPEIDGKLINAAIPGNSDAQLI